MATVKDYQGRRFDLLALRGAEAGQSEQLSQSLFGTESSGEVIAGIYKLSQRFILELLTEQGSMTFLTDRGTDFMTKARRGRLRTERDVLLAFEFALIDVRQNLVSEEDADMDSDERFSDAELNSITLSGDLLQLTVTITSVAGSSRQVLLPINLLPINI